MEPTPGHGFDKVQGDLEFVQQAPIPVTLQDTPTALNRVVFAMIGRIVGQMHREAGLIHELHQPLDELGAPTVVLGAIIQIKHQGRDVGKAGADLVPPRRDAVNQTVARHLRRHPVDKQLVRLRRQNAHGRYFRRWLEIVVHGLGRDAAFAAACERTEVDGRFRIHGHAQRVRVRIRCGVHLGDSREDGVGLRNFFWGLALATVVGW